MMKVTLNRIAIAASMLLLLCSCGAKKEGIMPWDKDKQKEQPVPGQDVEVGKPLPAWSEGALDIHAINTGRGECTFFILPDGTSLLVDAGEIGLTASQPMVAAKPNASTRAYQTYASYIKHFLPASSDYRLDYMLLTHFHNDHYGTAAESGYSLDPKGGYRVTGLMGLYSLVKFDKLFDRVYPNYEEVDNASSPSEEGKWKDKSSNYCKFVDYNTKNSGLKVEQFQLGSNTQIALLKNASAYSNFKIANVCANGNIWENGKAKDCFGSAKLTENGASCGFLLSYGKFDYLTCGDGGQNGKVENPLAAALNKRVEAMKAHHHMSTGTMTSTSMSIYRPQVIVTQSFYIRPEEQPHPSVLSNLYQPSCYVGDKNFFFTNIDPTVVASHAELYKRDECRATGGHIVIRVAPGGDSYNVYVLDDTNSLYNVLSISGPFQCN